MRILYFVLPVFFFSCSLSTEQKCFMKKGDQIFKGYEEQKPYSVKQILNEKPDYLEIVSLKQYRAFKKDSMQTGIHSYSSESESIWARQDREFKVLKDAFSDQFMFCSQQQVGNILYGLGKNRLGFWLLRIENNKSAAYFLGLSFSHYYMNSIQQGPIIKDGFLQFEGSLVKIIKVAGLPGYDDYSAMEDGKLFKINLKDLMKDSDNDGYNDIFEKSFGLNPNHKDTDGDGMNDFEDLNPMFASQKNKFSQLYELLLPNYGTANFKKLNYTFEIYETDCDYFHQISPELRVLFIPESKSRQTYYTRMTDVTDGTVSKIQTKDKDPDVFYIYTAGSGSTTDYSAEYKKGKWNLQVIGSTVS
ncbi:hypothetical protein P2W68_06405 [Chryseobacterium arthrosphaerae]|uniref:hypothetical protein n=1 Tax=Chryseobacterium arthrosphaerae TaxID=651561 RepID=UPI0023E1D98D|nr:hypothetical protein [Chryseobacterium arthrosphaerae]WES99244.1 hypothetical protein P2W68_06405 [Chryseobacterium arthrosphaerae]